MTAITELYARYHGEILSLAVRASVMHTWKSQLREILRRFEDDSRRLPLVEGRLLCQDLASQIEQEALRFSDPESRAVCAIALKHLDSMGMTGR